jgi:hypothetical protein
MYNEIMDFLLIKPSINEAELDGMYDRVTLNYTVAVVAFFGN